MSIGRPAIIAAQAIVVGVLVVVVYLTLLRPEDEGTLSGVDAPGGTQITQQPVPGADRRDGRGENGAGAGDGSAAGGAPGRWLGVRSRHRGHRRRAASGDPGRSDHPRRASPTTPRRSPTTPGGEPGTPDSDQYRTRSRGSPSSSLNADAREPVATATDPG